MEIRGKIHLTFEQSGVFKNQFKKLGYDAFDYDIQNNFGETDYVIDLFVEIEKAYAGEPSIFDSFTKDDLLMAFFPCIYFECMSMTAFAWSHNNYRTLTDVEKTTKIIERAKNRYIFYDKLLKLIHIVMSRGLRMILENPYAMQHYFKQGNFVKHPDLIDNDRTQRGDYFQKPTAYWFFNCKPTHGYTKQPTPPDKIKNVVFGKRKEAARGSGTAGLCSEERSMISPDYARNFICDNILGKTQKMKTTFVFGKKLVVEAVTT